MEVSKEPIRGFKSSHQVDKVLVADLAISVAFGKGQQDFQFVGVQFRAVSRQKVSEPLRTDEARILWVVLRINQDRMICNPSVTEDMAVETHTSLPEMTEHF